MTHGDWAVLWRDVAARVAPHREDSRGHLLTEDTVRMETVRALETAGVGPKRVRIEVPNPRSTSVRAALSPAAGRSTPMGTVSVIRSASQVTRSRVASMCGTL